MYNTNVEHSMYNHHVFVVFSELKQKKKDNRGIEIYTVIEI